MNLGPGAISKLPLLPPHPRTSLNASSIFMCCAQILIFFHKFSDSEDSDDSDKITSPIIGICIHETIWVDFKTKVDFKRVNDFLCTFLNDSTSYERFNVGSDRSHDTYSGFRLTAKQQAFATHVRPFKI